MLNDLVPSEFHLGQNYPNPFRERTIIKYCLPHRCRVSVSIYDEANAFVEKLVDEEMGAGTYEVVFEPKNLPAGTYFCELEAERFREKKEMRLIGRM